jgi:hypothetical protein
MDLLNPKQLWSRDEVLAKPCPVPQDPGVYGWYFWRLPPSVDATACHEAQGHKLLYVGIAPKAPPTYLMPIRILFATLLIPSLLAPQQPGFDMF